MELGGQAGKDALADLGNGTGLWGWGAAPLGHIINDSELIAGALIKPMDRSSMETPLQAGGMMSGSGSANASYANDMAFSDMWTPIEFGGYLTMPTSNLGDAKLASGVFDLIDFKVPSQGQFPKVY